MRRSGNRPNLTRGLAENSIEVTGARARNILIFLASAGIRVNAIKPVGQKEGDRNLIFWKELSMKRQGQSRVTPSSGNMRNMQANASNRVL